MPQKKLLSRGAMLSLLIGVPLFLYGLYAFGSVFADAGTRENPGQSVAGIVCMSLGATIAAIGVGSSVLLRIVGGASEGARP